MKNKTPDYWELLSVQFLPDWAISLKISVWIIAIFLASILVFTICKWIFNGFSFKYFEIDQAEVGTGTNKIRFKPNMIDRQVAYAIWVELSTRKIGLPIDFEHDVIADIYSSWYDFFSVTRDLIKSIPVNKVRRRNTQQIIKLSIEILNEGLRPHLTKWQARFRRWYEHELNKSGDDQVTDPQEVQKHFPEYSDLKSDMQKVNQYLITYRMYMYRLVMTE